MAKKITLKATRKMNADSLYYIFHIKDKHKILKL